MRLGRILRCAISLLFVSMLLMGTFLAVGANPDETDVVAELTERPIVEYRSIHELDLTLYVYLGEKIALLMPHDDYDDALMNRIVDTFDKAYRFYAESTGKEPNLYKHYEGRATIAVVPETCGAGCAYLGATGIEILEYVWRELYEGVRDHNQYEPTVFFELGRNFWHYDLEQRLGYHSPDQTSAIRTGFAIYMRYKSMDAAGADNLPWNGLPFDEQKAEVADLLRVYLANPDLSWDNTLRIDHHFPNRWGLGSGDLFAAKCMYLERKYGDAFLSNIWKQARLRPISQSTQEAVDNFIMAASYAVCDPLIETFSHWRWPISDAVIQETERLTDRCTLNPDHTVRFYRDANFGNGYCPVNEAGSYPSLHMCSDYDGQISSMLIKPGWSIRLYKEAELQGGSVCLVSGHSNFANLTFDDGSTVNDQVSSFALYNQPECPPTVRVPDAPTLLNPIDGAMIDEGQEIDLSWSGNGDEYWGDVGGPGGPILFGWQAEQSYRLSARPVGYTYLWWIKARNGDGEGPWSEVYSFTVRPLAPSELKAKASACEVTLTWSDNSQSEQGYRVYRDGALLAELDANVTRFGDADIKDNPAYTYEIKAFYGNIESASSNVVSANVPPGASRAQCGPVQKPSPRPGK
jgi:hypothetical protein